ncbi:MYB binding protein 1a isoform X2 [Rhodnius prolixus]|uniref:MYB binding protein 1a isoform X2 n=1 Tax=Rhodnius prolixus TaxID=13249 RepID=UPI003D18C51D
MSRSEFDMFTDLNHSKSSIKLKGGQMILAYASKDKTGTGLVYALKRVVGGLAGRKMREGCYATLAAMFQCISKDVLDFETYDKLVNSLLAIPRSTSKREKSDLHLGRLLAYSVLLRSNYLDEEPKEIKEIVADAIFKIALTKPHLHHPAFLNLVHLVNKYNLPFINKTLRAHLVDLKHHTLDKLYYLLNLTKYCKNSVIKEIFQCEKASMMHQSVLVQVADLLLTHCTDQTSLNHPIFHTLAERISSRYSLLTVFWKKLTEEATVKQARICKVALQFLYNLLMQLEQINELVEILFTTRVIFMLRDNAQKDPQVKRIIERIVQLLHSASTDTRHQLIMKIFIQADCINFDNISNTKLCSQLMNDLDSNAVMELCKVFQSILNDSLDSETKGCREGREGWTASEKLVALSYYYRMIFKDTVISEKTWLVEQLIFLEDICLFNDATKNINSELSRLMRTLFYNALGHIPVNYATHCEILAELTSNIKSKINSGSKLRFKLSDEDYNEWLKLHAWADKMYRNKKNKTETHIVLLLLSFYLLLNVLRRPKESIFNLKDVVSIFANVDKPADQEPHWSEILMDIFLNLLSKPVSGHRFLVQSMFKVICKNFITASPFLQLIEILNPENDLNNKSVTLEENMEESEDEKSDGSDDESVSADSVSDQLEGGDEGLWSQVQGQLIQPDIDNASVDLDDADENEINKLNELVGNLFKNRKIRTKKLKITQSELTHFRIRVLDLLEICCKEENEQISFSNWLMVIPVLVKLFKFASKSKAEEPLYNKLVSCMKKMYRLSVKDLQISEYFDDVLLLLNLLLEEAAKSSSKVYRSSILIICKLLAKAAIFVTNENCYEERADKLVDTVNSHLERFFQSRSNIPNTFFTALIDFRWSRAYDMLLVAAKFTFDSDIKHMRRCLGLQIIEAFFLNSWYFNGNQQKDKLKDFEESFSKVEKIYNGSYNNNLKKFLVKLQSFVKLLEKKDRLKYFDCDVCHNVKQLSLAKEISCLSQDDGQSNKEDSEKNEKAISAHAMNGTNKRKIDSKLLKKRSKYLRLESINMDSMQNSFYSLLT